MSGEVSSAVTDSSGRYTSARVRAAVASARGQRTRSSLAVDAALVLGSLAYAWWCFDGQREIWPLLPDWWRPLDVTSGVLASLGLWWRRRHPVLIAGVLAPVGGVFIAVAIAAVVAVYTVASLRRTRIAVSLALIHVVIAILYYLAVPVGSYGLAIWTIIMVLIYATALALGLAVRARRQVIAGLVEAAAAERREQEVRLLRARESERARIAREMHDVLAHRLSLLSVHAGALEHRSRAGATSPPTPDEVRDAAGVMRLAAHVALEELRDVLDVLGSESEAAGGELGTAAPQPNLAHLDDLVAEAVAAGQRVTLHLEDRAALAQARPQLQRTIFRTVQESLTNARKHAPGALVDVSITTTATIVAVHVSNPVPVGVTPTEVPGSRAGLIGLAERIQLDGGRLDTGIRDGSFRLEATLPWRS